jgi:hypothetical protein
MTRPAVGICLTLAIVCTAVLPASAGEDNNLAAARKYVQNSERYMHHSRIKRGMKGYGLSVLSGTKIEKFDLEVVSVLRNFNIGQDVVLAKISSDTFDFEKSKVIAGMSGSPMFLQDPNDGKFKMIGALAYGWSAQAEPLCGIQPITQMLAISGVVAGDKKDDDQAGDGKKPPRRRGRGKARRVDEKTFLRRVLNPKKQDFALYGIPSDRLEKPADENGEPRLVPLATPVMISGLAGGAADRAGKVFSAAGLVPLQTGKVGGAEVKGLEKLKLEAGSAISVPMVIGDADWYGVGTVTDVIDGRVLAFGHAWEGEGEIDYPMATAYVHTVVKSILRSFKLASTVKIVGAVDRDEYTGVTGEIGKSAEMIPMTVTLIHAQTGRKQQYKYKIIKHKWMTAALARALVGESVYAWNKPPDQHHIDYRITVAYDKLGKYTAGNHSSNDMAWDAISDTGRVIYALTENPYAEPVYPERIDVSLTVSEGANYAQLLKLSLDGSVYKPGDTVTGKLLVRRFRRPRTTIPVTFKLPKDIEDGAHTLQACDFLQALSAEQRLHPHKYAARTPQELFRVAQKVVKPQANDLYLRMTLPGGGVAIHRQELPDLPDSKAKILAEADLPDARDFGRQVEQTQRTDYVLSGSATATVTVRQNPEKTAIHEQENQ